MATIKSGELTDLIVIGAELTGGVTFDAEWVYYEKTGTGNPGTWERKGDDLMIVVKDSGGNVVYWQSVSQILANPTTGLSGAVGSTKKTSASFTLPASLTDGTYTIEYYRQDGGSTGSGTTAPSLSGWSADGISTFTVDTKVDTNVLNTIKVDLNPDPEVENLQDWVGKVITGGTEAGAKSVVVSVKDSNGTLIATISSAISADKLTLNSDGTWSFNVPDSWNLVDGSTYTFTVVATDAAGNTDQKIFTAIYGGAPPLAPSINAFTFTTDGAKWKHDVAALGVVGEVSGTAEPGGKVLIYRVNESGTRIDYQEVMVGADGKWSITPKIDGREISLSTLTTPTWFTLESVDALGNSSRDSKGNLVKAITLILGAHVDGVDSNGTPTYKDDITLYDETLDDGSVIRVPLSGTQGDDLIIGYDGDDILWGRDGNDNIFGGGGKDTILGGKGDDIIAGGTQGDWLEGGNSGDALDRDTFLYSRFNESSVSERDTIADFNHTQDRIDVKELLRALGLTGGFISTDLGVTGSNVITTKVKGKVTSTGETAGNGSFWVDEMPAELGSGAVLFASLSGDSRPEFAINLLGINAAVLRSSTVSEWLILA